MAQENDKDTEIFSKLSSHGINVWQGIGSVRVFITQEIALLLLATSSGNRVLRSNRLAEYKAALFAGDWKENGDAIRIDENGSLIDGHHRLECCASTGIGFWTFVVTGVKRDAVKTIDKGSARSNKDELTMHKGYSSSDAGIVAGMARHIVTHDNGYDSWVAPPGYAARLLYPEKLFEWVDSNAENIRLSVEFSKEMIKKGNSMLPKSSVAALHFMSSRIDKESSEAFMRQVFLGHNVPPESTQDHLRTILLQAAMKTRKMDHRAALLTAAKCLKSHLMGRGIKHLGNAVFRESKDTTPFFKAG